MLSKFADDLSERLHLVFPHANHIVIAIDDSVVVSGAVDENHLIIPSELDALLKEVAKKHNLRANQLHWEQEGNNLIVHLIPDLTGATIIEAKVIDKADKTYAVRTTNGEIYKIFKIKEEAEKYIKDHSNG